MNENFQVTALTLGLDREDLQDWCEQLQRPVSWQMTSAKSGSGGWIFIVRHSNDPHKPIWRIP